jgi:hypothetical protein
MKRPLDYPPRDFASPSSTQTFDPRCILTSRLPERCGLVVPHADTGARVTELALLKVADLLYPSGAVKPEAYLLADITKSHGISFSSRPNVWAPSMHCLRCVTGAVVGFPHRRITRVSPRFKADYEAQKPKLLNSRSTTASWTAGRWCTGPATRCSRQSAGFIGGPLSNWVHSTAADARSRIRHLLPPAMSRQCKRSLVMSALTAVSPIYVLTRALSVEHLRCFFQRDNSAWPRLEWVR